MTGELVIAYKDLRENDWHYVDITRKKLFYACIHQPVRGVIQFFGNIFITHIKTIHGNIFSLTEDKWVKQFSKITVNEYTRKEDIDMSQRLTEALDAVPLESGHPVNPTSPHDSALSTQEGGNHYKTFPIQPVEYITKNSIPYLEGNVIKYVSRHSTKNGIEDIKKAIHYLQLIAELRYGINLTAPK